MVKEFSFDYLSMYKDLIIHAIRSSVSKEVVQVTYPTVNEFWQQANAYISARKQYQSRLEAFITLWLKNTCYHEEWDYDWQDEELNQIMFNNLLKESQQFSLELLSEEKAYSEMDYITNAIKDHILKKRLNVDLSNRDMDWGIRVNHSKVVDEQNFVLSCKGDFISAWGIYMRWNEVQIFLETNEEFLYFDWGTSV